MTYFELKLTLRKWLSNIRPNFPGGRHIFTFPICSVRKEKRLLVREGIGNMINIMSLTEKIGWLSNMESKPPLCLFPRKMMFISPLSILSFWKKIYIFLNYFFSWILLFLEFYLVIVNVWNIGKYGYIDT